MTKPDTYFDLASFPFSDIFDGIENVWDILPKINEYTNGKLIKGENCMISQSANIREGVVLGNNVHIGHCVELKNCMILNDTHVAHLNYVGDSIIGNKVNVAGGAMFANFRLDKRPVSVKFPDGVIDTGLEKFSAIVGDNTQIGVNAVLNPGTILGKDCVVYPLTSVRGVYQSGSVIK